MAGSGLPELPDFEALYRADPDPWQVASSFYERRKLALVLAALSRPDYHQAWDPACGTGHLAAALAGRCTSVRAGDASAAGVAVAQQTGAGLANLSIDVAALPFTAEEAGADLAPDLVVLSEFLYYLDPHARTRTLDLVQALTDRAATRPEILAVHWRHHPHDAFCSGADIQAELGTALGAARWRHHLHLDDPEFVLDTWIGDRPR